MDEMIGPQDAAKIIGVTKATLLIWYRHEHRGLPKMYKLGPKKFRFKRSDVEEWLLNPINEAPPPEELKAIKARLKKG